MTAHGNASEELTDLIQQLVRIDSVNPTLVAGGAGEAEMAEVVAAWLDDAGLEVEVRTVVPGRPNVLGRVPGRGDGPTLLLLGHTDTVTTVGMTDPLRAEVSDGRLRGRGAYDMKGGLAAAMCAATRCLGQLNGNLVVAAVCDEEAGSLGARALLDRDQRFDAAIIAEPTDLAVGVAHFGYAGYEIETTGLAAHGSRPDLGEDAIVKMAPVLIELADLGRRFVTHTSLITGGEEESSYPARCVLRGEWRTAPGDDPEAELRAAIIRSGVDAELRMGHTGVPFRRDGNERLARLLQDCGAGDLVELPYWTDAALLQQAGIPTVLFGPSGGDAHGAEEHLDLGSVLRVQSVLEAAARAYCGDRS